MVAMELRARVDDGIRRAKGVALDLGVRTGVTRFRPTLIAPEQWSAMHRDGATRYYRDVAELARYSLAVGYLETLDEAIGRVLDVGCGVGGLRDHVAHLPFAEWVGVDLSEEAVAQAQAVGFDRSSFRVADATRPDGGLGTFDTVVLNEVVYYFPDVTAGLAGVEALVRPGGAVVTSVFRQPGDRWIWKQLDARFELVDRVWARNERNVRAPRGWQVALHRRRP